MKIFTISSNTTAFSKVKLPAVCAAMVLIAFTVLMTPAFGKRSTPMNLKLTPIKDSSTNLQAGTGQKPFLIARPIKDSVEKTAFVLGLNNASENAIQLGISNITVTPDKGKPFEVLSANEAAKDLSMDCDNRAKDVKKMAFRARRNKNFKASSASSEASSATQMSKTVASKSLKDGVDYKEVGGKNKLDEINQAEKDALADIENDRKNGLKYIEDLYLKGKQIKPGEGLNGYFEVKLPRRLPDVITVGIEIDGESYEYRFQVDKQ